MRKSRVFLLFPWAAALQGGGRADRNGGEGAPGSRPLPQSPPHSSLGWAAMIRTRTGKLIWRQHTLVGVEGCAGVYTVKAGQKGSSPLSKPSGTPKDKLPFGRSAIESRPPLHTQMGPRLWVKIHGTALTLVPVQTFYRFCGNGPLPASPPELSLSSTRTS